MERPIMECVPNFSEGRDPAVIEGIAGVIRETPGVKLLHVDTGRGANRTVISFAGDPDAVVAAAFMAIKKAAATIDMRRHYGVHPRMGATDVCPLIPVSGMSTEEAVKYARRLGERVARELGIPVYLYEYAAMVPERRNLAIVRAGEYEGLEARMKDIRWKPDFGEVFNPRSGATAIGVRDFLVAYNVNLNTTSVKHAKAVASDIRESGRIKKESGRVLRDEAGHPLRVPGMLKAVKATGWYIPEYGIAQVSMNLTDLRATPVHKAFEACRESAARHGMRVTGSEIVGLIPLQALLEAGRYYLQKQQRSAGVSEDELVKTAVRSLGLDDVTPFDPDRRILERLMEEEDIQRLGRMDLSAFAAAVASENPVPGAIAVNAYTGALAASLAAMVANMEAAVRSVPPGVEGVEGEEGEWFDFSGLAEKGQRLKQTLLRLMEEDNAFELVMKAVTGRTGAGSAALRDTLERGVVLQSAIMKTAFETFGLAEELLTRGAGLRPAELGSALLCARSAIYGAFLRLKVLAGSLPDPAAARADAENILRESLEKERRLLLKVQELIETGS